MISIIIATYGEERWRDLAMTRAYPSALSQGAHEIIVGHDEKGTRSSVRNALVAQATGDWLLHLDADDELAPGFVAAMEKAQRLKVPAGERILLTPAVRYVGRGRRNKPAFWPEKPIWEGNWIIVGTLVERALFDEVGGWHEFDPADWNEWDDWEFWIRCQKAGARVVRVREAVYVAHDGETRHRTVSRDHRARWHYEIGRMHFPEHYPPGWMGQG